MKKGLQVKVNHHYVWAYYLNGWAVDNKVYWLTPKGNIAHDSTKGMCREKGLYKISVFDPVDVEYIRAWSRRCSEDLQKQHAKQIAPFIDISNAIRFARSKNLNDPKYIQAEEVLLNNYLEDTYARIECGARRCIDAFRKGDTSVLNSQSDMIGLYSYLGHQVMRTYSTKSRFFELAENQISQSSAYGEATRLARKNWWFISFMLGENLGFSLYASRNVDKLILVNNISQTSFVTSDSPVVNVHPENDGLHRAESPEKLDLLFSVSPSYALMINSSDKWGALIDGADENDVVELNEKIASNARYSIYGNSQSIIKANRKYFGNW
ncbi:MAG: DUF4238 domain-containing protein [Cellvibrio sp.]|uniref:DUF4238 domain-containing protein n=1 Tax=Cellvibrio sp. TaxID=1965322 RepID=UPI00271979FD|nr:DUF4238 domain-containing protein [Cellvibrio sp.]